LKALPGVAGGRRHGFPAAHSFSRITPAEIEGRPPIDWSKVRPGEVKPVSRPTVTLDYFNAMGIR
jgi:hypothetical protein